MLVLTQASGRVDVFFKNAMTTLFEASFVINFLVSYFSVMNLNYATVFNCWNPEDNRYLIGNLSGAATFVQLVDLGNEEVDIGGYVKRIYERSRSRVGVFLEFGCPKSSELLGMCAEFGCFSTSVSWLMLNRNENVSVLQELENTNLFVDAEIHVLAKELQGQLRLYDVFNNAYSLGGKLNVTLDREVTVLSDGQISFGESMVGLKSKYQNRNTLSDIILRIGTVSQLFPYTNVSVEKVLEFLESYKVRNSDAGVRIGLMLTKALEADLKYRINYTHYDRWSTNDSYGGTLGATIEKQIDFSISGMMNLKKRLEHLTPILNYMTFKLMFIFKTPEGKSLTDSAFLRPFALETWISIILTILLGSFVVKLNFIVEGRLQRSNFSRDNPPWFSTFVETLGNFCQQGSYYISPSYAGRLIQLLILFCSLVAYNYYTSEIVSTLIGSPKKSDIKTLTQLADSHLQLGVEEVAYAKAFFLESHLPDVDYLVKKKFMDSTWVDATTGLDLIRYGRYAYHCEKVVAYNIIRDTYEPSELCDLNELNSMPPQGVGFLIRKDSHFRELFTLRFARMHEAGIVKKFVDFWVPKKPDCLAGSIISSVTIEGAFPIFLLLIVGTVAAFVAFGLESGIFRAISNRCRASGTRNDG